MVSLQRRCSLLAARRGALRSTYHKQFVPYRLDLPATRLTYVANHYELCVIADLALTVSLKAMLRVTVRHHAL